MMQLTIYNHNGGPCYRCLFPTPPPRSACQSCADNGVLGVGMLFGSCTSHSDHFSPAVAICSEFLIFSLFILVPGIIGCLQALEAIKIAAAVGEPLSGRMLLFDALSARIRVVC
jgi:adenylyltransferase and sulfurtransferase